DPDTAINAEFTGAVEGVEVAVTGHTGSLTALLERRTRYPVYLDGQVAGRNVTAKAAVREFAPSLVLDSVEVRLGGSTITGTVAMQGQGANRVLALTLVAPRIDLRDLP